MLALYADHPQLLRDPDRVWGVASGELLSPGLVGLMLACMLAALMSSADTYMLVCAALVVRNVYAAYLHPDADEKRCIAVGRVTAVVVIVGAVLMAWLVMDVFRQLQLTWVVPMLFAAPFWMGMYWRGATRAGAWWTVIYVALVFFVAPYAAPILAPGLRTSERFTVTNDLVTVTTHRPAVPADVRRREAEITLWRERRGAEEHLPDAARREAALSAMGPPPRALKVGENIEHHKTTGGTAIYWTGGVKPVGPRRTVVIDRRTGAEKEKIVLQRYDGPLEASGNFRLDFLLYDLLGVDMRGKSDAMLRTMELVPKIVTPFLVMFLVSLVTRRNDSGALDRFYAKMKTPVQSDAQADRLALERSFADPSKLRHLKLFPGTDIELQRPRALDVVGFLVSLAACFGIVWLAAVLSGWGG